MFRKIVILGVVLGIIAAILCTVGFIFDGIGYGRVDDLETCYNKDNAHYYGRKKYEYLIKGCNKRTKCTCVNDDGDCKDFDLRRGQNCDHILHEMRDLLLASWIFCVVCFCFISYYTILAIKNLMSREESDHQVQMNQI
jgi:hypothetical protein